MQVKNKYRITTVNKLGELHETEGILVGKNCDYVVLLTKGGEIEVIFKSDIKYSAFVNNYTWWSRSQKMIFWIKGEKTPVKGYYRKRTDHCISIVDPEQDALLSIPWCNIVKMGVM